MKNEWIADTEAYYESLLEKTARAENTSIHEVRSCLAEIIAVLKNSEDPNTRAFWQLISADLSPEEFLLCITQLYQAKNQIPSDNNGEATCSQIP